MDTSYLHSLKHRIQSRLEQAKLISEQLQADKEVAINIIQNIESHINPEDMHQIKAEIETIGTTSTDIIDNLLDELEIIEKYDWRYVTDVQDKSTALILASYEEPLRLKTILENIIFKLADAVSRATDSHKDQNTGDEEQKTSEIYSTPSLKAMQLAIEKFWRNHEGGQTPPTQKAVSNYIAEQLGKPIRDRFTDELARAIKPD